MISTSGSKIVRIPWKAAQVGTKSPREFQNCFTNSKDWISEEKTSYPLEIILMLIEYAKIYKIVIEAVDEHIPKKVDVLIEQTKSGERFTASALLHSRQIFHGRSFYQPTYQNCGSLIFSPRTRVEADVESRTLFTNACGKFIKLIVDEPHEIQNNPRKQVGFKSIAVYGYLIQKEDNCMDLTMRSSGSSRPTVDQRRISIGNSSSSKNANSLLSIISDNKSIIEMEGMISRGDLLGDEPLVCLRTLRNILAERQEKAIEALRYHLAMRDCRDTAFRIIHVDLLLNSDQLRAFGISSKWST